MSKALIANLTLKDVPQATLLQLHRKVVDELNARDLEKRLVKSESNALYKRSINGRTARRSIDDLFHPEWDELFPEVGGEKKFYVYAHMRPHHKVLTISDPRLDRKIVFPGMPFYIGKGTGDRAWNLNRNEGHGVQLRSLLQAGKSADKIVRIVRDKMTESQAFKLEAKLIYYFGTKFDVRVQGSLVNLEKPKRPSSFMNLF